MYVIVFNEDRPAGSEPDPRQIWRRGQIYSVGSVVDRDTLPPYFTVIEVADAEDVAGMEYDFDRGEFVPTA